MKYVVLIYSNPVTWESLPEEETDRVMGEHMALIDELTRSGELVTEFGMADPSNTKTLRAGAGVPVVTDGPFIESKEQLAGVFVVDCESQERALELAAILGQHGVVEVRPVMVESGTEM